jgi:aryl-phospho-beta-D-glucosidase BglC (GH1 family)
MLAAVVTLGASLAVPATAHGAVTNTAPIGFVHRDHQTLVDGSGTVIKLRGFNLGNWLVWESQLMGSTVTPLNGQKVMLPRLASVVGSAAADQFFSSVQSSYITQADFQEIASLGFNSVRVPIPDSLLESDSLPYIYKNTGWQVLDNVVSWAQSAGLYVIFDLHAAPGGQNNFFYSDPVNGWPRLWGNAAYQQRTVTLWRAIAARYADSTTVAGYDLLNEPSAPTPAAIINLYKRIITAVRAVDPNHLVILEGTASGHKFTDFTQRYDENMAISLHQYFWLTWNPAKELATTDAAAKALDVPLWIGESGWDSYKNVTAQVTMYNKDPEVSGWSFWTWKAAANATKAWGYTFPISTAWKQTVQWMAAPKQPQPPLATIQQGMADYLSEIAAAQPDSKLIGILQAP